MSRFRTMPLTAFLLASASCPLAAAEQSTPKPTASRHAPPAGMELVLIEFDGTAPNGQWDIHHYPHGDGRFPFEVRPDALVMTDKENRNQHLTRRGLLLDPRSQYAVQATFAVRQADRTPNSFCLNFHVAGDEGALGPICCWAVNVSVEPGKGERPDRGGVSFNMGFVDGRFRRVGDAAAQDWSKFDTEYTMRVEVNTGAAGRHTPGHVRVTVWEGDAVIHRRQADYTEHPYQPDPSRPVRVGVNSHGGNWVMRDFKVYSAREPATGGVFGRQNLLAWCIVPFDAAGRGPDQRAAMLERLGITRLAYDWRAKDVPTFDEEVEALNRHGIKLEAFWCPCSAPDPAEEQHVATILDLLKRHRLHTQLWVSLGGRAVAGSTDAEKVESAARAVKALAEEAARIGCPVGLYNHGGWFGEPENQIAIIEKVGMDNVGIVYNFHHGHGHMDRFAELLAQMKPHLLALNLNGMKAGGPKILPLGEGDRELEMLQAVKQSGYQGPVGILDHRSELDAELSLKQNLEGLQRLLREMGDEEALATYANHL